MDKKIILGISFAIIVAFSGCDRAMSEAELLSAAKSAYTEKSYSEASIHLKKILQKNSNHFQARYLLGEVYLSIGLWRESEKELLKSVEISLDEEGVYPKDIDTKLAKVYYYLTDLVGLQELNTDERHPINKQVIDFYIATLQTKTGDLENGKIAFNQVIQADATTKYAELALAHLSVMDQNYEEALNQSSLLLTKYPLFTDALEFEGFLNFQLKKYNEASEAFKKYLAIHFNAKETRLMYASALSNSGNIIEAEKEVDLLLDLFPNNPLLNEIKAEAHFSREDYRNAKLSANKALNSLNDRPMASIIAGVSSYELDELESAYTYLQPLERYIPISHPSMILLNTIRFELGYSDDAFMSFKASDDVNLSSQILSLSAKELLLVGRVEQANELIDKAILKEPKNSKLLYKKGIVNLATNKSLAIEFLTESLKMDPTNESAIAILVHSYVVDKKYDLAIELIDTVKYLHNNYALQLLGMVYREKGDLNSSKKYFTSLLEINSDNSKGILGLASIALLAEETELAIKYYVEAYKLRSHKALTQLVKLSKNTKFNKQILSIFNELSLLEEEQSFFKVGYVELLLKNGAIDIARQEINKAYRKHSLDKDVLLYKARILIITKQYQPALSIYDDLLVDNPDDFMILEHKSYLLSLMRKYAKAIEINKKLSEARPQSITYLVNLINNHIDSNSLSEARELIVQLTELSNAGLIAKRLNGKLLFIEQEFDRAIPLLNAAYERHQSLDVLTELIQSLQSTGQYQKALNILLDFDASNAINVILMFKKAELLQATGQIAGAITEYENITSLNSKNYIAYNNLAWLFIEEKNYKLAKINAVKAFNLDKTNDDLNHTLGLSELYLGNEKEALAILSGFSNSTNDNFKVALVEALIANDKITQAKELFYSINSEEIDPEAFSRYKKVSF